MSPQQRRNRAEHRLHMENEIMRLARQQLISGGTQALSLREIARELDVASSALYRYFADRDALLTRMIIDAYSSLAVAVEGKMLDEGSAHARLRSWAHAVRSWALGNPELWGLLYGTPVPGFQARASETNESGIKVIVLLGRIISDAGEIDTPDPGDSARKIAQEGADDLGLSLTPAKVIFLGEVWGSVCGAVSMEVFQQLGDLGDAGSVIVDNVVRGLTMRLADPINGV